MAHMLDTNLAKMLLEVVGRRFVGVFYFSRATRLSRFGLDGKFLDEPKSRAGFCQRTKVGPETLVVVVNK